MDYRSTSFRLIITSKIRAMVNLPAGRQVMNGE
jgi:hypothetical protein